MSPFSSFKSRTASSSVKGHTPNMGSFTKAPKFYGSGLTAAVNCAKRASAAARAASGALMISDNSWGRSSISKVRKLQHACSLRTISVCAGPPRERTGGAVAPEASCVPSGAWLLCSRSSVRGGANGMAWYYLQVSLERTALGTGSLPNRYAPSSSWLGMVRGESREKLSAVVIAEATLTFA
jgi:hypothetical protein